MTTKSQKKSATGKSRKATYTKQSASPDASQQEFYQTAKDNPWRLFSGSEIEDILGISHNLMTDMRKAGLKFPGNRCRPEWVIAWLSENPDFLPVSR